jgi:hypothetical protein
MRWARHVALGLERRCALRVLVGKDVRKRPVGKSKLMWQGRLNIKVSVQEWWGQTKKGLIWISIGTIGGFL